MPRFRWTAYTSSHVRCTTKPRPCIKRQADGPCHAQLLHTGATDAVDVVVLRYRTDRHEPRLLLVPRHDGAPAEHDRFATLGGFVLKGESLAAATIRELAEEARLRTTPYTPKAVGVAEGNGRDPWDTGERCVRSHLFVLHLRQHDHVNTRTLIASSDTSCAFFVPLSARAMPGL